MTNKKNKKDNYSSFPRFGGSENIVDIDKEEELEEFNLSGKKKWLIIEEVTWELIRRWSQQPNHWCFCVSKARKSRSTSEREKMKQSSINDEFDKKEKRKCMSIHWMILLSSRYIV